ncbi:BTAD domain-containing putative transcriptional regulator [Streptomyces sp. NPDC056405]|uniref:BTAD domain-containing putative transcriptional regulator n=1 Tax=Streptomyces sp. NPDC056405 TaxID=3345811 RepID=UPI0035DC0BDB
MLFGLLGPLAAWGEDGETVRVPEAKVRMLLAILLINEGQPVSTARLIEYLWDEDVPANPASALRTKVSILRRQLARLDARGRQLLVSTPAGYRLDVEPDRVDVTQFQDITNRAYESKDPQDRASRLAEALALWRGPALADFSEHDFAQGTITRLEEKRLTTIEEWAEARLLLGEHSLLVGDLNDLVVRHPMRERLRAAHMLALYRTGRQSAALASYADLRSRLGKEFGLDPGAQVSALHESILANAPELEPAAPPVTSVPRPRINVPSALTKLIGRAAAVHAVKSLVASDRLVTLTGPGGVGKTRLAQEVAHQLAAEFPDGVWLVELAEMRGRTAQGGRPSVTEVAETVAATLDLRDNIGRIGGLPLDTPSNVLTKLGAAVRGKDMLLVLDNCDHLIEPVAELADMSLRSSPELRVLATSREPLGLLGEVVWSVLPLELPETGEGTPEKLLQDSSAVQLFVERARAAVAGFTLNGDNVQAVTALCHKLDGIPLALEIAATSLRVLNPHELLARLDDRLALLDHGPRGAPPRQQTLRAMIDWSWQVLDEPERAVLRRLALLKSGWTVESAETVTAFGDIAKPQVFPLLARLVNRSLVATVRCTSTGTRYRLLGAVTAYSLERLEEADEFEETQRLRDLHYAGLCERALPHLRGLGQNEWLRRLDADLLNTRAALESALRAEEPVLALRMVNALSWYWLLRGRLDEARRWTSLALARVTEPSSESAVASAWQAGFTMLVGAEPDGPERTAEVLRNFEEFPDEHDLALAEWFLGYAHLSTGNIDDSESLVLSALRRFNKLRDQWGVAVALSTRSLHGIFRSDWRAAQRNGEISERFFRELGDRWGRLQALDTLASLAEISGDYVRAGRLNREALHIAEELGLWSEFSHSLSRLGRVALLEGTYAQADELHERAARLAREQSDHLGERYAEIGLALSARRQGELDVAEERLWRLHQRGSNGSPDHSDALVLGELGFIAELRGDSAESTRHHLEGYRVANRLGDPRAVALALEGLAGARVVAGHFEDAAQLLAAAEAARKSVKVPLPKAERADVDRIEAAVRDRLDHRTLSEVWRQGARLSPEACLRLILGIDDSPSALPLCS